MTLKIVDEAAAMLMLMSKFDKNPSRAVSSKNDEGKVALECLRHSLSYQVPGTVPTLSRPPRRAQSKVLEAVAHRSFGRIQCGQ